MWRKLHEYLRYFEYANDFHEFSRFLYYVHWFSIICTLIYYFSFINCKVDRTEGQNQGIEVELEWSMDVYTNDEAVQLHEPDRVSASQITPKAFVYTTQTTNCELSIPIITQKWQNIANSFVLRDILRFSTKEKQRNVFLN